MADRAELTRVVERDVSSRDLKKLERALESIGAEMVAEERVLGAANGVWARGFRCLAVATSRRVAVADHERVELFPYDALAELEFTEKWRKASLVLRVPGKIADIKDIHLDRGRELNSIIQTARRSSSVM